jgi:hypothetical protein
MSERGRDKEERKKYKKEEIKYERKNEKGRKTKHTQEQLYCSKRGYTLLPKQQKDIREWKGLKWISFSTESFPFKKS